MLHYHGNRIFDACLSWYIRQVYIDVCEQKFSPLTSSLQSDASGEKLKDLAIEMGLTPSALAYLKQKVPQKTSVYWEGHSVA